MAKEPLNFKRRLEQLVKTAAEDSIVLKEVRTIVATLDPDTRKAHLSAALRLFKKHKLLGAVVAVYRRMVRESVLVNHSNDLPAILIDALCWCRAHCKGRDANSILSLVKKNAGEFTGSADSLLPVIAEETRTLVHFKRFKTAIKRLITAAQYFSRFGASQSAYRALGKADAIARSHSLTRELADANFVLAAVCSEAGDKTDAANVFAATLEFCEKYKLPVPVSHRLNQATVLMQLEKEVEAQGIFETILAQPCAPLEEFHARLNLAICKRSTTSLQASVDEIRKAQPLLKHSTHPEEVAEFHLVAAKTYLLAKKPNSASRHIEGAIEALHVMISEAARLHYRRGVREHYVKRIRSMIRPCVDLRMRRSLMVCLAFVFASTTADWCRYLEWCEASLNDELVSDGLKRSLREALNEIGSFGAPVLMGFREKYDDPYEEMQDTPAFDHNRPWTTFERVLNEVAAQREQEAPYNRDPDSTPYLEAKLAQGTMLLFAVCTKEGCELVALHGKEDVWNCTLAESSFRNFFLALNGYVAERVPRNAFIPILEKTSAMMATELAEILKQIVARSIKQVLVIADALSSSLPWVGPFVENTEIRRAMRAGVFSIGSCAFPFPGVRSAQKRPQNVRVVCDSTEPLPLLADELRIVEGFLNPQIIARVDLGKKEEPLTDLDQVDLVHYAGHGFPLSRYSDPCFAGITKDGSPLRLSDVQTNCVHGNHSVVFLNACHGASTGNSNFYQSFATSENIGFPSMFMLNRKSQVIAPIWAVPDLAAFAFSVFFYRRLAEEASVAQAYSFAVAEFFDATKADVVAALAEVSDEALRQSKVMLIENDPTDHPFRRIYCYGAYRLHCLL